MIVKKKTLTNTKISKRLIWIKVIRKSLTLLANSFTHTTSKRRNIIDEIIILVNRLDREIKRDIKKSE